MRLGMVLLGLGLIANIVLAIGLLVKGEPALRPLLTAGALAVGLYLVTGPLSTRR
jgi:hypothetical protein